MLFELGGKRKRFIQVIYVFLALLLGIGLVGLGSHAPFAFLARQRDRGAHALGHELDQPLDHPLVRVDARAAQHLAAVARAGPAGDLFRAVSVFLVVCNRIVQRSQDVRRRGRSGSSSG